MIKVAPVSRSNMVYHVKDVIGTVKTCLCHVATQQKGVVIAIQGLCHKSDM
jgi:hypothetical protein